MFTIITLPLIPLRAEADERSEMISQLLFAQVGTLETTDSWYLVKNLTDNCTGWIGKRTLSPRYFTAAPSDTSAFRAAKNAAGRRFRTSSGENYAARRKYAATGTARTIRIAG